MKKVIIGLCIVVTGFILFIVQDGFRENETANNGIDKMFSGRIFDDAQEKFTVHAMGIGPEEKVMTVRVEKTQYKEQAEEYFRDILNSHDMEDYELEVFADGLL